MDVEECLSLPMLELGTITDEDEIMSELVDVSEKYNGVKFTINIDISSKNLTVPTTSLLEITGDVSHIKHEFTVNHDDVFTHLRSICDIIVSSNVNTKYKLPIPICCLNKTQIFDDTIQKNATIQCVTLKLDIRQLLLSREHTFT